MKNKNTIESEGTDMGFKRINILTLCFFALTFISNAHANNLNINTFIDSSGNAQVNIGNDKGSIDAAGILNGKAIEFLVQFQIAEEGTGIMIAEEGTGVMIAEEGTGIMIAEEGTGIMIAEEGTGIMSFVIGDCNNQNSQQLLLETNNGNYVMNLNNLIINGNLMNCN